MSLSARINKSMNTPTVVAIFAIILGLIKPIRENVFAAGAPAGLILTLTLNHRSHNFDLNLTALPHRTGPAFTSAFEMVLP